MVRRHPVWAWGGIAETQAVLSYPLHPPFAGVVRNQIPLPLGAGFAKAIHELALWPAKAGARWRLLAMSRVQTFKPGDPLVTVTKAVKAAMKAVEKVGRVEIRIILFAGEQADAASPPNDLDLELAEFEARNGQD
jgi:hypothetical protein